ncbi:MAG: ribonuclease III [Patescibacteria group bacterium]
MKFGFYHLDFLMSDFPKLEKKLGIEFRDKNILTQAFCHRSYLNENPDSCLENNERLEFLGDAVLELVVTEYLYQKYEKKSEGELTNWRAALVNAKMLSEIAKGLDFNDFILLSRGELKENGKARQYILANTFEAFVGALYLDQGYEICQDFITKYLLSKLAEIVEKGLYKDDKSHFQEEAQEISGITPTYRVMEEWGPDHAKNFIVGVFLEDEMIAKGQGSSKQEAEVAAAKEGLKAKHW